MSSWLAMVSANCGGFDQDNSWAEQVVAGHTVTTHRFTDDFFPPRKLALHPRLQAKIPKFFAWQWIRADVFLWVDASFEVREGAAQWMMSNLGDADAVFFRHPSRKTIEEEYAHMQTKGGSRYMRERYAGEWLDEQYRSFSSHETQYRLLASGIFAYRATPGIRLAMRSWWYHVTRYNVQDQISQPVALAGCDFNVIDADIFNNPYFAQQPRRQHA